MVENSGRFRDVSAELPRSRLSISDRTGTVTQRFNRVLYRAVIDEIVQGVSRGIGRESGAKARGGTPRMATQPATGLTSERSLPITLRVCKPFHTKHDPQGFFIEDLNSRRRGAKRERRDLFIPPRGGDAVDGPSAGVLVIIVNGKDERSGVELAFFC